MAEAFKSFAVPDVGTTNTTIYTCPSGTTTVVIGLLLSNRTSGVNKRNISVNASLNKSGGASASILNQVAILFGASLSAVSEQNKIVLQAGDSISVSADSASAADAIVSVMEIS